MRTAPVRSARVAGPAGNRVLSPKYSTSMPLPAMSRSHTSPTSPPPRSSRTRVRPLASSSSGTIRSPIASRCERNHRKREGGSMRSATLVIGCPSRARKAPPHSQLPMCGSARSTPRPDANASSRWEYPQSKTKRARTSPGLVVGRRAPSTQYRAYARYERSAQRRTTPGSGGTVGDVEASTRARCRSRATVGGAGAPALAARPGGALHEARRACGPPLHALAARPGACRPALERVEAARSPSRRQLAGMAARDRPVPACPPARRALGGPARAPSGRPGRADRRGGARPASPEMLGAFGGTPGRGEACDGGEQGQAEERPQHGDEEPRFEEPCPEQDHPLGALHEAAEQASIGRREAERLRLGPYVGDERRGAQHGEGQEGELPFADRDEVPRHAGHDRVEQRAASRRGAGSLGDRAVEQVVEPGDGEEGDPDEEVPGRDHGRRRGREDQSRGGQDVGGDSQAHEPTAHGTREPVDPASPSPVEHSFKSTWRSASAPRVQALRGAAGPGPFDNLHDPPPRVARRDVLSTP